MTSLIEVPPVRPTDIKLRGYQEDAIAAVRNEYLKGVKSTLLVMSTGLGKTVSFGMVARMVAEKGGRTLVLAHRGELIDQAAETLVRIGLDPGIEKAGNYARSIYEPNVVVATVQTMQRERLRTWPRDFFKLIIVDECHHSTAQSYRTILDHFSSARVLGVTATAERTDDDELGEVFESVAYEYTLWEAMTAPAPGPYLSRLRFVQCDVGVDLRDIRTTAGDLNAADLEEAIRPHVDTLANSIRQEAAGRKTLVFTPDVGSAMAMSTALDSIGESPDRKAIIDGFKRGDFQTLCNCALLLEGFDCPDVSAIALCRPTKSRPLYTQMVGRGTRLAPAKENCLIIDFAWLTAKHDLVKPVELFGSTAADPEVAAIAAEMLTKEKGMDLHDVIEEAKEEKGRRTELKIKAQQRELKYRKVAYDPLTQMGLVGIKLPKSATSNQGTVTDPQRERLERWGFKGVESMSKSQASRVIDQYGQRLRRGMATLKQINTLIRNGMPAEEARAKTIREASDLIDVIFNGPKPATPVPVPADEEVMTWVA
jgi:superfamily II DNA or RNA helicase